MSESEEQPVITMEQILAMKAFAKQHEIQPLRIDSHWQAWKMRWKDPTGYKWKKGDEYYLVWSDGKITGVKA